MKNTNKACSLTAALLTFGSLVGGANAATILTDGISSAALSASGSWSTSTPDKAFDSYPNATGWNSGGSTGWLEADLGRTALIDGAILLVAMVPDGFATHEIYVSGSPMGNDITGATLAHTLSGDFHNDQVFTPTFTGVEGRYVQIRTTTSPSWVSWTDVQILGVVVPEPSSMALLGLGFISLAFRRSRN